MDRLAAGARATTDDRLRRIEAELQALPVRLPRGTAPQWLIRVGGGQGTGNLVLARPVGRPTALAAYDPAGTPPSGLPWPAGIGWGDLLLPTGATQRVLLAFWSTAPSTISTAIYAGTVIAACEQVSIAGAGLDPQLMWVPRHV